jgi:drug/metabolite transporter (DMT)-like permease
MPAGVHGGAQGAAGSVYAMTLDRPQYGEYASPEEQRARAGLPPVDQMPVASAVVLPTTPAAGAAAPQIDRRVGRMVTAVLLGVGLVNVLTSIPGFLNLSASLDQSLKMLGYEGSFSDFAAAKTWGVVALVVMMLGYAATVWLSVRRIRRNRSSWWLPLVGFAVTMIAVTICISVPMLGDPAFTQGMLTPPAG